MLCWLPRAIFSWLPPTSLAVPSHAPRWVSFICPCLSFQRVLSCPCLFTTHVLPNPPHWLWLSPRCFPQSFKPTIQLPLWMAHRHHTWYVQNEIICLPPSLFFLCWLHSQWLHPLPYFISKKCVCQLWPFPLSSPRSIITVFQSLCLIYVYLIHPPLSIPLWLWHHPLLLGLLQLPLDLTLCLRFTPCLSLVFPSGFSKGEPVS